MNPHPSSHDAPRYTSWSLVRDLHASNSDTSALVNQLCLRYRTPIHRYFLLFGCDNESATILSDAFLSHMETAGASRTDRHGRFREFLHAELEAFVAQRAMTTDSHGLFSGQSPESGSSTSEARTDCLERSFALEVMARGMRQLHDEAVEAGRFEMFERLKRYLWCKARPDDIEHEARLLDVKPLFIAMAIHRLRKRFRHFVDEELACLVTDPAELERERQAMLSALEPPP